MDKVISSDFFEEQEVSEDVAPPPATLSTIVVFSEKDIRERAKNLKPFEYGSSSSNFVFGDVSEVPSRISNKYFEEEEALEEESEGEEQDEEEEEQLQEDEVDWETTSLTSLTSGPSGCSGWEWIGRSAEDWDDDVRPGNGLLDYYSLELDQDEINGFLTDRIIATGQSCLGRCPGSQGYVYTKLVVVGKNLMDISMLQYHRYLQYIDLSWNQLRDVSPLAYARYLIHLDLPHNQLNRVLNFRAPWYLTFVNYSFNDVNCMDDLSEFWCLKSLNLSHNYIGKIEGLRNLRYLQNLDLSYNAIIRLENLSHLRIAELNLEGNNLCEYEDEFGKGLSTLFCLRYLNLNNNRFTTLGFLKGVYSLRCMEMRKNRLDKLLEIDHMKSMTLLEEVDFNFNPITAWPNYREAVIDALPCLGYLDGMPVSVHEKVSAKNRFNPDVHLVAAYNHTRILLLEQLDFPRIGLDILPVDQPVHPLIVLVGPTGSGKTYLMQRIRKTFGDKVYVGVRHTTRQKMENGSEVGGVDYHFVSQEEFNQLLRSGAFLSTLKTRGNAYGFSRMELAKAVKKCCMCITHMELTEALTLFTTNIRPCLILTISRSESMHLARLKNKYHTSKAFDRMRGTFTIKRKPNDEIENTSQFISSEQLVHQLLDDILINVDKTKTHHDPSFTLLKQPTPEMQKEGSSLATYIQHSSDDVFSKSSVFTAEKLMEQWRQKAHQEEGTSNHFSRKSLRRSVSFKDVIKTTRSMTTGTAHSDTVAETSAVSLGKQSLSTSLQTQGYKEPVSVSSLFVIHEPEGDSEHTYSSSGHTYSPNYSLIKESSRQSILDSSTSSDQISNSHKIPCVEKPRVFEDSWIRSVLLSRRAYLTLHEQKPGFFEAAFYTDDLKRAFCQLKNFLKEYQRQSKKHPINSPEEDILYEKMVLARVDKFTEEIDRHRSTMAQQRHNILHAGASLSTDAQ